MKKEERIFTTMDAEDVQEVIDVYISVFSAEPWNDELTYEQIQEYVDRLMNMNSFKGYVVKNKEKNTVIGAALGFIRPWYKGLEYHMDSFYVHGAYQSSGIGTALLKFIRIELEADNVESIILDTDKGYPSEHFYKKNGFTQDDSMITLYGHTTT